jgi:cytochrome c553
MKPITAKIALLAISAFAASPICAEELSVRNCNWCHGSSAQGLAQAPRIAGQRAEYIEHQIGAFSAHLRDNPYSQKYMWNAVANVSPDTARELAKYYAALPPRAADDGDKALVAAGETIYQQGVSEANVAACVVCHGPKAEGAREIPRLGGLSYAYVKRRLSQWNEGYHASARTMPRVARSLSANEVEALASYLSFVE